MLGIAASGAGSAAPRRCKCDARPAAQIRDIVAAGGLVPGGLISFRHTIFLWQSIVSVVIEVIVVVLVMWLATPPAAKAKTAAMMGIDLGKSEIAEPPKPSGPIPPGAWLEHSPLLNWLVVLMGVVFIARYFNRAPEPLNAITINILNLTFLIVGCSAPTRRGTEIAVQAPRRRCELSSAVVLCGHRGDHHVDAFNERLANAFVSIIAGSFPAVVAIIQRCWACSCRRADRSG
jgi:short-chain fatty acids transporter